LWDADAHWVREIAWRIVEVGDFGKWWCDRGRVLGLGREGRRP
jgi:hypothetical protein